MLNLSPIRPTVFLIYHGVLSFLICRVNSKDEVELMGVIRFSFVSGISSIIMHGLLLYGYFLENRIGGPMTLLLIVNNNQRWLHLSNFYEK